MCGGVGELCVELRALEGCMVSNHFVTRHNESMKCMEKYEGGILREMGGLLEGNTGNVQTGPDNGEEIPFLPPPPPTSPFPIHHGNNLPVG